MLRCVMYHFRLDKTVYETLMIISNTTLVGHGVNDNSASVKMIQSPPDRKVFIVGSECHECQQQPLQQCQG